MAPILAIILLLNFFGSPVFADNLAWYVFWPEVPDNNHQTEGLGTSLQPANNEQFLAQLTNDAKIGGGGDVSACTSSSVGDGGSTWYWIAHIDQTVVQTKYLYDGGKSAMKMVSPEVRVRHWSNACDRSELSFTRVRPMNLLKHSKANARSARNNHWRFATILRSLVHPVSSNSYQSRKVETTISMVETTTSMTKLLAEVFVSTLSTVGSTSHQL